MHGAAAEKEPVQLAKDEFTHEGLTVTCAVVQRESTLGVEFSAWSPGGETEVCFQPDYHHELLFWLLDGESGKPLPYNDTYAGRVAIRKVIKYGGLQEMENLPLPDLPKYDDGGDAVRDTGSYPLSIRRWRNIGEIPGSRVAWMNPIPYEIDVSSIVAPRKLLVKGSFGDFKKGKAEDNSERFRIPFQIEFLYTPPELRPENALPPLPLADAKKLAEKSLSNPALVYQGGAVYNKSAEEWKADMEAPFFKADAAVVRTDDGPALRLRGLTLKPFAVVAHFTKPERNHTLEIPLKLTVDGRDIPAFADLNPGEFTGSLSAFEKKMVRRFEPVDIVIPLSKRFVTESIQPGAKAKLTGSWRSLKVFPLADLPLFEVPFELEFTWPGK